MDPLTPSGYIVPKEVIDSIINLVGYNWEDEHQDFLECAAYHDPSWKPESHIFFDMKRINDWLKEHDLQARV